MENCNEEDNAFNFNTARTTIDSWGPSFQFFNAYIYIFK